MTLQQLATQYMDKMYNPLLPPDAQCGGWYTLKGMVENDIQPNDNNMSVFHPILRGLLIEHWDRIKELEIEQNIENN